MPIDINGSGTVTHATDSACAGCIANSVAASSPATRSRSSLHASSPSKSATAAWLVMLSRCHPHGDNSLSMKFTLIHKINTGR
jgi:hypothetical protein